ncbi:MAG: hexose kinase [Candidatus Omnitrophota bacterium]|nr:hexose kinase [Candidatus Omnitrophota bacterium]MDZ4242801.1 hexose kinase [Candidatus Omnitrophota bacterium]
MKKNPDYSRYVLTVTLNPAVDKVAVVPDFRPGRDQLCADILRSAGGKGINVSRGLKILRVRTLATGIAGGGAGRMMLRLLDEENIRHDFVVARCESRTNLTVIDPVHRRMSRVLEPGPVLKTGDGRRFVMSFRRLLRFSRFVVISGRPPAGLPSSFCRGLVEIAQAEGLRVAVDTSGPALREALKARPFLVKVNCSEAQSIIGRSHVSRSRPGLLRGLRDRGAQIAIITLGPAGAVASDGKDILSASAPRVTAVNTVGCGDAFLSGFLAAYLAGDSLAEGLRMAAASGAASACRVLPVRFIRADVERLAGRVRIMPLR